MWCIFHYSGNKETRKIGTKGKNVLWHDLTVVYVELCQNRQTKMRNLFLRSILKASVTKDSKQEVNRFPKASRKLKKPTTPKPQTRRWGPSLPHWPPFLKGAMLKSRSREEGIDYQNQMVLKTTSDKKSIQFHYQKESRDIKWLLNQRYESSYRQKSIPCFKKNLEYIRNNSFILSFGRLLSLLIYSFCLKLLTRGHT